jgi:large subunit ribosomal protein L9
MTKKYIALILNQKINHVGETGDVVKVTKGYARNYLLPKGIADIVTPSRLKYIAIVQERKNKIYSEMQAKQQELKLQLETIGKFSVKKKIGEADNIFGSITEKDIIQLIHENTGEKLSKNQIQLTEIKKVGLYPVQIRLMENIVANIQLQLLPEIL